MAWFRLVYFFGGVFLANVVPHFGRFNGGNQPDHP
jgi:hypothetical protein